MTTKPKSGRSPSRGAAARAEKGNKPRKVEFDGLEFTLPQELPETVLFDIVEIEASQESNNPIPLMRFLRSILGAEQFTELRNHLAGETAEKIGKGIAEVIEAIFAAYGVTPGESQASPDS